jgi:hypothetical protein
MMDGGGRQSNSGGGAERRTAVPSMALPEMAA